MSPNQHCSATEAALKCKSGSQYATLARVRRIWLVDVNCLPSLPAAFTLLLSAIVVHSVELAYLPTNRSVLPVVHGDF